MKIERIMHTPVATVELDDTLKLVRELFEGSGFRHLLVVDEGSRLMGLLSERDMLRAVSPYVNSHIYTTRDLATLNQRVHQIMHRKIICMHPSDSVATAVRLFNEHKIGCIPVVNEKQQPVGIVTRSDLLRSLCDLGVLALLDELT